MYRDRVSWTTGQCSADCTPWNQQGGREGGWVEGREREGGRGRETNKADERERRSRENDIVRE